MSAGRPRRGRVSGRTAAVLGAAYWSYFVNGMANSIIGPVLLSMVHTFHIGLAAAGAIVTAQFIGYLPGALGSGMAAERWGYRRVLVPSTLLMAAGTIGTALAGAWPFAILLMAAAGVGFGTSDSLCNAVVAQQTPGSNGPALNLLHTFFGVGALVGPLVAGALLSSPVGWQGLFVLTGALASVSALSFLLVPLPVLGRRAARGAVTAGVPAEQGRGAPAAVWRGSYIWILAAMLLVFVGMEQTVGAWSSAYLTRVQGADIDTAARSASVYWAAVTCGRLLASAIALRLSSERLLGGAALISLCALVTLALSQHVSQALMALSLTGLGFAAIYPTIMAITARAYARRFAAIAGFMAAAGGMGGAAYPWIGGIVGQAWGLRATFWMAAALAVALLGIYALLSRAPLPLSEAA
jgi:fucose permease